MPKIHVSKSVLINAPVEKVFETVHDFNHWTIWSPWLIQEPEASVKIADDAKSYAWEGKRVGTGKMHVTAERTNESVDYNLTFLKPWKSTAKVRFELQPKNGGTEVTWLMDSKLPFFLFWMKRQMTAFIGRDYERGLALLKDYAEDGTVHSKLQFKGISSYLGCHYIARKTVGAMEEAAALMKEDLSKVNSFLDEHKDLLTGAPFTIYHKWDVVKGQVTFTAGVPVNKLPKRLPQGMVRGEIPSTTAYTLVHIGPYDHLGNAWSTLYNMHRNKAFKINKKIDPFEVYINDPGEVAENDLITEIHFPVR